MVTSQGIQLEAINELIEVEVDQVEFVILNINVEVLNVNYWCLWDE